MCVCCHERTTWQETDDQNSVVFSICGHYYHRKCFETKYKPGQILECVKFTCMSKIRVIYGPTGYLRKVNSDWQTETHICKQCGNEYTCHERTVLNYLYTCDCKLCGTCDPRHRGYCWWTSKFPRTVEEKEKKVEEASNLPWSGF